MLAVVTMEAMLQTNLKMAVLEGMRSDSRVAELISTLGERASDCHLIGGAVRDLAIGRVPVELDVVVVGDAVSLATALDSKHLETHERFLTATHVNSSGERSTLHQHE